MAMDIGQIVRMRDVRFDPDLFKNYMTGTVLDELLCSYKGLPKGVNYMVIGDPGVGKTTIILDLLSQEGEINEHLRPSVGTAEEKSFVAEDASALVYMGVNASEHLAFASCLRHIGVVYYHAGGIFGVPCIGAYCNVLRKLFVDMAENVTPVNPVIGKNAIEHILLTVKERLKRAANIVRHVLYGEEREESHHLNHLSTGEFTVGFLFESHLLFRDVNVFKNLHYPLYAESAATFCEKIAQL